MPSPSDPTQGFTPPEESFLELLAETLENLDRPPRGQFLQRFFKTIAQLDLSESLSLEYWEQILERRRRLADMLSTPISLKAAMVDVLASSTYLRVPILMEYDDLKKLQINAATDPLTGLYNRRLFEEQFEKELNRAVRYSQHLALVILDLHQFKEVNDRYGHPQGDLLLQTAATTLRKSLRTSDYAFRIGGDEFALLLVHSDSEQANTLARRIRANFQSAVQSMQGMAGLGIDYGIAVFPEDGDQKDALVRIADRRLYEMKHLERGREAQPQAQPQATPGTAEPPSTAPGAAAPPSPPPLATLGRGEKRKWERVSLAATRAYAQLTDDPQKMERVIDLGYGGLALETELSGEIGSRFSAVLHVPILPPVRVRLRRVYQVRASGGQLRVGCAFVS